MHKYPESGIAYAVMGQLTAFGKTIGPTFEVVTNIRNAEFAETLVQAHNSGNYREYPAGWKLSVVAY
jgi:predicted Zn-dependent peptidase